MGNFLDTIEERGFLHQCTDIEGLRSLFKEGPVTAYVGFDLTSLHLHVGSLVQIMLLRWFSECGHKPIVLLGRGTTTVGDPTGRDQSRVMLSKEDIAANGKSIWNKLFDITTVNTVMDNTQWLESISYMDFMRDYGKHFSVKRMLAMDSAKSRMEAEGAPLSLLEFNYMAMQAYDFNYLRETKGCRVQFGGADQWSNIIGGIELHRRLAAEKTPEDMHNYQPLFGLTTPLMVTTSGQKMGKTVGGAISLSKEVCSPYDYWQFWRNTQDQDVGRFLRLFTELSIETIQDLEKLEGAEINEAKKILATEATAICHGHNAALEAVEEAERRYG